jgi:hypothetical protein
MELGLSSRDRRTLIVGVSAVGVLLALGRGVPTLVQWQSAQRAEAATISTDLAVARAGARLMPQLLDSLRSRQARLAAIDSAMLGGSTPAAAAAGLASALQDIAADASVKVSAMQLQADSAGTGGVVQVGVRVTAVSDVYGLLALLRALEGGRTLLAVRELAVTQPEPAAPASKQETLRLDVMVVGLARIAAEAAR